MTLVATPRCPVCKSGKRSPATGGMAANRKDAGLHYLKHAAQKLSMTPQELGERVKIVACGDCGASYCDPWLDAETASYVFTAGAPDHIAGWANFEHWLSSERKNDEQEANERLYDVLEKRLGTISTYAEFGCPFQGFLLMFRGRELSPSQRISAFSKALNRAPDMRWTGSAKVYHAAAKVANLLAVGYHRLRALKERRTGSDKQARPICHLYTQETVRAWGSNCTRYGGSCRYYTQAVLGADVVPFASANGTVDLLGIFNSLDHTDDPVGVLKRALTLAKHVVVSTHHATQAGKQHQYAFDEGFPAWLSKNLPDAAVVDLTPEVSEKRHNNYTLISRKHG